LSDFQIFTALRFNPLVVLAAPAGAVAWAFRARLVRSRFAWPLFFGAVLLNWLYLLAFLPR
jgi:hypothetical protein